MAFTLRVSFRCMCFFVPDPDTGRMYVLMPDTQGHEHHGHGGHGVDPHVVRIIYPTQSGGSLLGGTADILEMEGWELVLPGTGAGAGLGLPDALVNLSATAGPVRPGLLAAHRDPKIIARIVLDAGGATGHESGAKWIFGGEVREMAQEIIWTVPDLEGDRLTWRRTRLKAEGEPDGEGDVEDLPPLTPAEDGVIRLEVYHVLASDFPAASEPRMPEVSSEHFAAYYDLFTTPGSRPLPKFKEEIKESPTITCIVGRGNK